MVDCDLQSPGIHTIFRLDQETMGRSLNDYLWGECRIEDAAHDVTPPIDGAGEGRVWLVPASIKPAAIARLMHEGYDVSLLNEGCRELAKALSLDVLILDTHPGLNEETLLSIAMSNAVAIVMRPDRQDYEGTRVTLSVASKLKVPRTVLIVNKIPEAFDSAELRESVATTYQCEVAAVLPHSEELMILSSGGIFVVRYPEHPLTRLYGEVAARLMA